MPDYITISQENEVSLKRKLKMNKDTDSQRVLRFLNLPDLSRQDGHPVKLIIDKILGIESMKSFDVIETPEISPFDYCFDLFNFPSNHPARTKSDTYFVNDENILRPHTTIMWYYYLGYPGIKEKLERNGELKFSSYGKCYRKDEIDWQHYPVFHQIDAVHLIEKEKKQMKKQDLIDVLLDIAYSIYGEKVEWREVEESFPYTDPSLEIEIKYQGEWVEVLCGGIVQPSVLENCGIDSSKYNGRAYGFGVDRLAMIRKNIPDIRILWSEDERIKSQWGDLETPYEEVSKYPLTYRDISFIINKDISLNHYFELVRDVAGDVVEEVKELDKYENDEKFGSDKMSYTFRVIYRSHERTLTNDEVNDLQGKLRELTEEKLGVELR